MVNTSRQEVRGGRGKRENELSVGGSYTGVTWRGEGGRQKKNTKEVVRASKMLLARGYVGVIARVGGEDSERCVQFSKSWQMRKLLVY